MKKAFNFEIFPIITKSTLFGSLCILLFFIPVPENTFFVKSVLIFTCCFFWLLSGTLFFLKALKNEGFSFIDSEFISVNSKTLPEELKNLSRFKTFILCLNFGPIFWSLFVFFPLFLIKRDKNEKRN